MALLLLDLGTVRQEGPEVTGLLLLRCPEAEESICLSLSHRESDS